LLLDGLLPDAIEFRNANERLAAADGMKHAVHGQNQ